MEAKQKSLAKTFDALESEEMQITTAFYCANIKNNLKIITLILDTFWSLGSRPGDLSNRLVIKQTFYLQVLQLPTLKRMP